MKIEYTYKIISVDNEAKCMEIVYTSEKYGNMHVGARLPWVGETLEQIVEMYNPTREWVEKEMEVIDVQVDTEGVQEIDTEPTVDPEIAARIARDHLLFNADWTQLADAPLSQEQKAAWAVYRQQLRDVPQQEGFPENINWPEPPTQ